MRFSERRFRLHGSACFALLLGLLTGSCATRAYRFADVEPVTELGDDKPIPVPGGRGYTVNEYYVRSIARHPLREELGFRRSPPSGDVNALDDLPASSWYTPRLGYRPMTPEDLLRGPLVFGPPEMPITVVKAKVGGGNPGFIIADVRGVKYLVKFDPPEFPGIETTTAQVVNRLFWGFGYNVPEDYLVFLRAGDLQVDPEGELTRSDVDGILERVAPPVDGRYRATASRFINGKILGPIWERGVREDDPNDLIPHQDRRIMRAMHVFCAFTNQSGIRPDNSLDTYVGEAGEGHVKHFLLDFGEAFGGHGAEHRRPWDGFEHAFDGAAAARQLTTLGLVVQPWERVTLTPWSSVGAFESEAFIASDWQETYSYLPIRSSQPPDDYWAAKIVGALTRQHIQTLVDAASYPEPGAADYVVDTIMERRRKILQYYLYQVTPVESEGWSEGELHLSDVGRSLLGDEAEKVRYDIRFYDDDGSEIAPGVSMNPSESDFEIPVPQALIAAADGYVRIDVAAWRSGRRTPRPAQFHIRRGSGGARLVGVVH